MSARRSARLSPANTSGEKACNTGPEEAGEASLPPKNKRPRRAEPTPATASAAAAADGDGVASPAKREEDDGGGALKEGPSAYELQRLEKMKKNAMMMAALGLGGAKGEMRTAVNKDAAERAKARGLGSRARPKRHHPVRTRESARVRGIPPEGLPTEESEDASNHPGETSQDAPAEVLAEPAGSSRISGDVSMEASNVSEDGTRRLRQMMGGLVGRNDRAGDQEDYELAEPDDVLKRLRNLKVEETGVCKVVTERAYCAAWHPSKDKLLLAVGDKFGNVGLWTVGEEEDRDPSQGVFEFKPHTAVVPRITFDPLDGNKLITTSYDGTVRRMDVEKGAFEQVFGNNPDEDSFFTDGHLVAEDRLLMLSDGDGHITAVDLRTNTQVWKREAHEKKVNTVHTHPTSSHLFVTASLDRSVKLWDARNLGAGSGPSGVGGMKHVTQMPHFLSVNSAHFSPTGEWMATVSQDDKIRLYQDLAEASGRQVSPTQALPHNNRTGRWLTKFQASWDPKSKSLFGIGSMQKNPHGLHLYSVGAGDEKPSAVGLTADDFLFSIPSVVAFHPSRDIIAGVNASGRAYIFS
ncbi:unnamed protein product [Scytosiphon promiscuus]